MTSRNGFALVHRKPGLWAALWLALCLLIAQHAGLTHRIAHGGTLYGAPRAQSEVANPATAATSANPATVATAATATDATEATDASHFAANAHSCVLFDGAAVGAGHCGTPVLTASLSHGKPVLAPNIGWHWPDLARPTPFDSRAPPARLAFA